MTNAATKLAPEASPSPYYVNITLQGKGGVGKSVVSALLTQHSKKNGRPVVPVDTDPVNATLSGYTGFEAKRLELMVEGQLVERKFDGLMHDILEGQSDFVIDNGASSFLPLSNYLAENDAISMIVDSGKRVYIHTVITGSQALEDTLAGFDSLASQLKGEVRLVVWLNEYFGAVERDGKKFEDMQVYQRHKNCVHGIVRLARQTNSTFGEDFRLMLDSKLTFDQVKASEKFGVMSKSRLGKIEKVIFDQLDQIYA